MYKAGPIINKGGLEDVLVESGQHILLGGASNGLKGLMGLTLSVVVLHIVQRCKGSLDRDIVALVAGVIE